MAKSRTARRKPAQRKPQRAVQGKPPSGKTQKPAPIPTQKERGGWLAAAIIFVIVHGILLFGVAYGENYLGREEFPAWFQYAIAGAALADIVAGIALWNWKGWGFYLYLASVSVIIVVGLLATGSALFAFSALVPFAIVGYLMRSKWKYFS